MTTKTDKLGLPNFSASVETGAARFLSWGGRLLAMSLLLLVFLAPSALKAELIDPATPEYAVTAVELDDEADEYDEAALDAKGAALYKYIQFKGVDGLTTEQIAAADGYFERYRDNPEVADSGHTAWMIVAAVLVLLMTLPDWLSFMGAWCGRRTCSRS